MSTMQAVWLEDQKFSYRDNLSLPAADDGEALIKVKLAGICATDLEMGRGYYPYTGIPGHEFVGEVVVAPDAPNWSGKRVVGEINITCGECEQCRAGREHHCERRKVLGLIQHDGVFAEYVTLPVKNLHRVPEDVPDEMAVFTEPLAAALEIQQQVHIYPEDRVLVIGAGRLGLLVAQTLALTGCHLSVVVRHPHQRSILASRNIHAVAEEDIRPASADVVVEATGAASGFQLARKAVRPAGTIVLKSTYKGEMQVNFSPMVVDEIHLVGSRCGPFEPALRLLEKRQVDTAAMLSGIYPLKNALAAIEHAGQRGALKVLIKP
jgi:threonine dehydrogenase-like Zn-dependent dehydrogenase